MPVFEAQTTVIAPSLRVAATRYEIRGALARRARQLEQEGRQILHLNIGNPGRFGFRAPAHLVAALSGKLADSDGYCHEQGLEQAREAVLEQARQRGAKVAGIEQVFVGNGVSELIDIALRAVLQPGDEVLLPSPDYPLWSASTRLNDGVPCYYPCPASRQHLPDPDEMAERITARTRAIVLINPNNPTGAVYPRELLQAIAELARRHGLLLLSDEIYDGIVFDGARFEPLAPLAGSTPAISFGGLSKVHRAAGLRCGWMVLSGEDSTTARLRDALQLLAALRLCANVPAQWAVAPALRGADTISALTAPGGRLHAARKAVLDGVANSQFLELVAPAGAMYAFPAVRAERLARFDDEDFALRLLEEQQVLLAPGTSFNLADSRHFRLTLLPEPDVLTDVFVRIERLLERMAVESGRATAAA